MSEPRTEPRTEATANERLRAESWTDPDHGFAVVPLQDAERELNLLYGIIERLAEAASPAALPEGTDRIYGAMEKGAAAAWAASPAALDVRALYEALWSERDRLDAGVRGFNEALYRRAARAIAARLTAEQEDASPGGRCPVEGCDELPEDHRHISNVDQIIEKARIVSQWHGAIGSGPIEELDAELGELYALTHPGGES